jgi:Mrp family chromosome partitioning ATPase
MENIRQAVERAKIVGDAERRGDNGVDARPQPLQGGLRPRVTDLKEIELSPAYLESVRIVAHDKADVRSRSFDMLRTQVLQSMDVKDWRLLGITSPSASCGKTLTAVNLALSIARQPERSVLLVDMDLRKPQVAKTLGLNCHEGLLSLLNGQSTLADAVKRVRLGKLSLTVLPAEASTSGSSELMASRVMAEILREIRQAFSSALVILDLPPTLAGDDVIALLPQIDCAVLVAAVGTSTLSEIKQCNRHLHATEVIRLVLNKVQDPGPKSYYSAVG